MKKFADRSFALGLYSLLTTFSAIAVSNGSENGEENGHSLALSHDNRRFTEYVLRIRFTDFISLHKHYKSGGFIAFK